MRDQLDNINACCTPGKVVRGYLSCCSTKTLKYVALHILEKHFNNKCKLKRKSVIDFAVYRQFPAFLFHTYSHKPKRRFCAIFHVFSLCFHNRTLGLFSLYCTFLLISFFPFFSVLPGSQRLSVNSLHFSDPRSFPATTEYLLPIRHVLLKQERRGRARLQCRRGREKKIKAGRGGGRNKWDSGLFGTARGVWWEIKSFFFLWSASEVYFFLLWCV